MVTGLPLTCHQVCLHGMVCLFTWQQVYWGGTVSTQQVCSYLMITGLFARYQVYSHDDRSSDMHQQIYSHGLLSADTSTCLFTCQQVYSHDTRSTHVTPVLIIYHHAGLITCHHVGLLTWDRVYSHVSRSIRMTPVYSRDAGSTNMSLCLLTWHQVYSCHQVHPHDTRSTNMSPDPLTRHQVYSYINRSTHMTPGLLMSSGPPTWRQVY